MAGRVFSSFPGISRPSWHLKKQQKLNVVLILYGLVQEGEGCVCFRGPRCSTDTTLVQGLGQFSTGHSWSLAPPLTWSVSSALNPVPVTGDIPCTAHCALPVPWQGGMSLSQGDLQAQPPHPCVLWWLHSPTSPAGILNLPGKTVPLSLLL